MPWPVIMYIAPAMITSRQLMPHPQANGMAASTARNGMPTNAPMDRCSAAPLP